MGDVLTGAARLPLVCATVMADTTEGLRAARDAAAGEGADLVELRLDSVRDPDVAGALAGRTTPVLVTCRPVWEGGLFTGSEAERAAILSRALELGAELVDIEWRSELARKFDAGLRERVVVSHHVFDALPPDLADRLRAMRGTGSRVVKAAAPIASLRDLMALRAAGAAIDGPKVLVGMGPVGLMTRVAAARFGSAWSYAGDAAEVGQLPLRRLLEEFRFRDTSPSCDIYAIVGCPVAHSLSPAMHNAALGALGQDAVYVPLESRCAEDVMACATTFGIKGVSVTAPLKVELRRSATTVDPISVRVGAVNTLRFTGDRVEAINTDVAGFLEPLLRRGVPLEGRRAAILGSGGAARAVGVALQAAGARVVIHGRTPEHVRETAAALGVEAGPPLPSPGSWDLLVNATPVGTAPHAHETPFAGPFDGALVYDLVYNPRPTRLLREAASSGCTTIDGLEMLVAQACRQVEWWMGRPAPEAVMRAAAERRLRENASVGGHRRGRRDEVRAAGGRSRGAGGTGAAASS